jgi:hypothetical protein
MKSNISNFLYYSPAGRNNKKGEPWFAFFQWVVGADGLEPPTYAV